MVNFEHFACTGGNQGYNPEASAGPVALGVNEMHPGTVITGLIQKCWICTLD